MFIKYFVFCGIFVFNIKYCLLTVCGDNEVASSCANKLCQYTNCSQIYQSIKCVESSTEVCKDSCICKDKYLKADNGTCIPITDCPNYGKCNKENEYYDLCPPPCISRVCGVSKLNTNCSQSKSTCQPACICKVGFYRNYDQNCVVESLCASNSSVSTTTEKIQSTPDTTATTNTTSSSSTTTSTTSTTTTTTSTTTSPTSTTTQTSNNTKKCGRYEKYERNPCTLCQPFNCSQVGYPLACLQSNYSSTCSLQPECICDKGYVKNDKNVCVPVKKCPSCGGDVNAESGCRVTCPTCKDYWKVTTACSKLCKLNGCGCKRGYVYDEIKKKCVLLRNYCSPKPGK